MTAQDWKDLIFEAVKQGPWFLMLASLVTGIVLAARWMGRVVWPSVKGFLDTILVNHREGMDKLEKAIQGGTAQTEAMKIGFDGLIGGLGGKLTTIDGKVDTIHQGVQSLLERRRADRQEEK